MDNKIASYGLVGVSLFLALGLFLRHNSATEAQKTAGEREEKLLGALKVLEAQGTALRGEADLGSERLKARTSALATCSNKVETLTTELIQTRQNLAQATAGIETVKATLVAAQNETRAIESRAAAERAQLEKALGEYQRAIKDRDTALSAASQANEQLAKQAADLSAELARQQTSLKDLQTRLASREQELGVSRGETGALRNEIRAMAAQRGEWERQLNDSEFLREQLAHVKSAASKALRPPAPAGSPTHPGYPERAISAPATKGMAQPSAGQSPEPSRLSKLQLQPDGTISLVPIPPPTRR